jgi:hypothetical protein
MEKELEPMQKYLWFTHSIHVGYSPLPDFDVEILEQMVEQGVLPSDAIHRVGAKTKRVTEPQLRALYDKWLHHKFMQDSEPSAQKIRKMANMIKDLAEAWGGELNLIHASSGDLHYRRRY